MEQNSANLIRGILTGCLILVVFLSLASKAQADEIIRPPAQQAEDVSDKALTPTIYFGSRGSIHKDRDLWGVSRQKSLRTLPNLWICQSVADPAGYLRI